MSTSILYHGFGIYGYLDPDGLTFAANPLTLSSRMKYGTDLEVAECSALAVIIAILSDLLIDFW